MAILYVEISTTVEIEVDDAALHDDSLVDYGRATAFALITHATRKYNTALTSVVPVALKVGGDVYDLDS